MTDFAEAKNVLREFIQKLERLEEQERIEEAKRKAFEDFQRRSADWIVGKAHFGGPFRGEGWPYAPGQRMAEFGMHAQGNMGVTYFPTAHVTHRTFTYFHNAWSEQQRAEFQRKLNELVRETVAEMVSQPQQVLELLAMNELDRESLERTFPEDKVNEVIAAVKRERAAVLSRFTDEQLKPLTVDEPKLSHSNRVLREYLAEHRPHLLEENS